MPSIALPSVPLPIGEAAAEAAAELAPDDDNEPEQILIGDGIEDVVGSEPREAEASDL